jgi:hypothetical protein
MLLNMLQNQLCMIFVSEICGIQDLTQAPDPNLFGMLPLDPYIMNTGFFKFMKAKSS